VESQLIEVMNMKMQMIQFVSIVNLIQMRLMKVIHKMKNRINEEFEQSKESQLIQVMIHKIQMIQFVSIVNLIQMKLMKVIHRVSHQLMSISVQPWIGTSSSTSVGSRGWVKRDG
jgi:NADH:ubiquinone oxidoreductase subunit 3 (subunit A)